MYTLVVALALASLLPASRLRHSGDAAAMLTFWLLNWVMLGLHYYAVLVLAILFFVLAADKLFARTGLPWRRLVAMFAGALLPLGLWMLFAPSFHETVSVVLAEAGKTGVTWHYFLSDTWRELSFGNIRWLPPQAYVGFLLAPPVIAGALLALQPRPTAHRRWLRWFATAAVLLPILGATVALRTLAPRYMLYIVPFIYLLAALSVTTAAAWRRSAGITLFVLLVGVNAAGLLHYFGPYRKSDYRAAVQQLVDRADPAQDLIVLEAPRQHLLARYYLPVGYSFTTVPAMDLPTYWPATAPVVVPEEEDGRVQAWLADYRTLWVIFAGEGEVDLGEFFAKYLDAVSYPVDCDRMLDLRLCQYRSPRTVSPTLTLTPNVLFGEELALESVVLSIESSSTTEAAQLFAQLNWLAVVQPAIDYKVSLRLVPSGDHDLVIAQHDQFPIGTLLPPTTWATGDRKPGYVALHLPVDLAPGTYALDVALYDAATLASVSGTVDGAPAASPLVLVNVTVDDTITLEPVR